MNAEHVGAGLAAVAGLAFVAMVQDERGRERLRRLDQGVRDWLRRRWRDWTWRHDRPGRHADPGRRRTTRRETRRDRDAWPTR